MPEGRQAEDLRASKGEKSPPAPPPRRLTDREARHPALSPDPPVDDRDRRPARHIPEHGEDPPQEHLSEARCPVAQRGHCQGGTTSRDLRRLDGTGDSTRQTSTGARPRISWMARPSPDSGDGDRSVAPSPHAERHREAIRRLDRFQQAHGALGFPWAVLQKFGNDQASSRAALIAYYGLFAIFPLLAPVHHHPRLRPAATTTTLRKDLVNSALGNFPIIGTQLQSETHTLRGQRGRPRHRRPSASLRRLRAGPGHPGAA